MASFPPKRRVNCKALLVLLGSGAIFGVSISLAHCFQVKCNARDLLDQAALAQEEGRPEQAAEHLTLYLGLVPADAEALARYGLLLHQLARTPETKLEAYLTLERALAKAPERADVRRQAATAALELGYFDRARTHLQTLLKKTADAQLLRLMGRCEAGVAAFEKAAECFARAARLTPTDSNLATEYARLLRQRRGKPRRQIRWSSK